MNNKSRKEHPKPQMERTAWQNLNGEWDFAFDFSNSGLDRAFWKNGEYSHKINVPFCPESELSGIGFKDFINAVWYRRSFCLSKEQLSGHIILHFGAVDYLSKIWINGKEAGWHKGGYSSFSIDITDLVCEGKNTLVVYAFDDVRSGKQPGGKQSPLFHSHACYYTRTTGIWQTVWLEFTPKAYIKNLRLVPDPENACLHATCKLVGADGGTLIAEAFYEGRSMGKASVIALEQMVSFRLDVSETYLWQPGSPCLYDLELRLCKGKETDKVKSYFGLRSVEWKNHALFLNGEPVFQRLILDQNFFHDGIYTAPSDEALAQDIQLSMDLGFNGARMHEKVFEERYLYHADKMGYLIWGEMANWNLDITTPAGLENFLPEWLEVVERDFNHPALIGWCPFNETWDNNGTKQNDEVLRITYLATKALDPTRPVIDTSGNFHVVTDIYDIHDYEQDPVLFEKRYGNRNPGAEFYESFTQRQNYDGKVPFFVSEFGGARWAAGQNANDDERKSSWGYGNAPRTEEEFALRYEKLVNILMKSKGVCAFCYTQLTDVEQEMNGLYTYDRKKKFGDTVYKKIRAVNGQKAAVEK